jgi:hypothetical protein
MPAEQQRVATPAAAPAAPPLPFPLVTENGFRVCGLPANATRATLQAATTSIRRALKLDVAKPSDWDLPWLGRVARTEAALQTATGRLADVERRLIDRLFWFGANTADLARLGPGALVGSQLSTGGGNAERSHDVALLMLAHATVADPSCLDGARWQAAISAWQKAVGSDDYWAGMLDSDQGGGFEPTANLDDVMSLRRRAFELGLSPIIAAAKAGIAAGNEAVVARIVQIMRAAPLGDELRFGLENQLIGPMEEEILRICGEIRTECRTRIVHENDAAQANKAVCGAATQRLDTEIVARLGKLERMVGKDAVYAQRSRGEVAHAFGEIAACWTWADDFVKSEELLKRAQALAVGTPAQGRIEQDVGKVAPSAQWQRDKVTPVKSPPPLFTLNGFGITLYSLGIKYPPKPEWQYATLFLVFLFIPVLPLRRYLVRPAPSGGWYFHATVRFGVVQWLHLATMLLIGLGLFIAGQQH